MSIGGRDRGPRGLPGTPADPATTQRNAQRLRVLFAIVLAIFALLAWRTESQQRDVSENATKITANARATCLGGLVILRQFNATQAALIDIERTIQPNPKLARARIKVYEKSILPVDPRSCDANPPPPAPKGVPGNE